MIMINEITRIVAT